MMHRGLRVLGVLGAVLLSATVAAASLEEAVRTVLAQQAPHPFSGVVLIADGVAPPLRIGMGVPAESRFMIGSLSKQMTAALVLRAAETGRISPEATVAQALGASKRDRAPDVTVRQLLNHTSGFVALGQPLHTKPGEVFAYSNAGYDLLGELLAAVGTASLARQYAGLFAQCGMRTAGVLGDAGIEPAAGFEEADDGRLTRAPATTQRGHVASGGVVADAIDLLRWNRCLYGGVALSAASLGAMTQPTTMRPHRWGMLGYGYGLQIADTPLGVEYSHSGYAPGAISTLAYYPRDALTLVVLENTSWRADDIGRAFHFHDALRALLFETYAQRPAK